MVCWYFLKSVQENPSFVQVLNSLAIFVLRNSYVIVFLELWILIFNMEKISANSFSFSQRSFWVFLALFRLIRSPFSHKRFFSQVDVLDIFFVDDILNFILLISTVKF